MNHQQSELLHLNCSFSKVSVGCLYFTCFTNRLDVSYIGTYITGQKGVSFLLFIQGLNITFMTNHNSEEKNRLHELFPPIQTQIPNIPKKNIGCLTSGIRIAIRKSSIVLKNMVIWIIQLLFVYLAYFQGKNLFLNCCCLAQQQTAIHTA